MYPVTFVYPATLLSLLFMLSLAGCVPNSVAYYYPTVDGGALVRPRCVPTDYMIDFALPQNGGRLHVRAWADNGGHVHQIALFFSGNSWNELHFTSTRFRIRDVERHETNDATSVIAYKSEGIGRLTVDPYIAPPERLGISRFHIQINSADPLPAIFDLLSPSLVLDGKEIEFPSIHFEQKRWVGISPFNC
ncbi:MAG: hypothetical protein R3F42_00830 [Pseudomonadota bacterium]